MIDTDKYEGDERMIDTDKYEGDERMIDTDKYEGHTPGPWKWTNNWGHVSWKNDPSWVLKSGEYETLVGKADGKGLRGPTYYLIADAPRLLAEVKRLQKRNEWLEEVVALAQEHGAVDLSDYGWPQWGNEE